MSVTVRDTRFEVRLKPAELNAWRKSARLADMKLSEWIRTVCNNASTEGR